MLLAETQADFLSLTVTHQIPYTLSCKLVIFTALYDYSENSNNFQNTQLQFLTPLTIV